jgi:hypothetical protein
VTNGDAYEGLHVYQIDTKALYIYQSADWALAPASPNSLMTPTSVSAGMIGSNGTVTSGSVASLRVNGVLTTAFREFAVKFDITTASSTTLSAVLSAAGSDTTTGYDNQRLSIVNTTSAAAQSLNNGSIILGGGVASTRHVGMVRLRNPAGSDATYFEVDATVSPNPMTTAHGKYVGSGLQQATTSFDGIRFVAASGNLTVNYLSVVGTL